MKSTGIVRKVDDLGRIVIPMELRKLLCIDTRDSVEIFVQDDTVILKKYQPSCIFCGSYDELVNFKGKLVCPECIAKLKNEN